MSELFPDPVGPVTTEWASFRSMLPPLATLSSTDLRNDVSAAAEDAK